MIPAILLFFGMMFLPESPRWLASKDRWEETRAVLALTHGHGDPDSPFVAHEFDEIREWIKIESEASNASYLELFRPRMLNRTIIGVFMQIWSQLTGMNVMVSFFALSKFCSSQLFIFINLSTFNKHSLAQVDAYHPIRCTISRSCSRWQVCRETTSSSPRPSNMSSTS
jgi:hypothetical protein